MFYALAPLIVRRKLGTVLAVMAGSFAVRGFTYKGLGFDSDPWNYRFFPSDLAMFLSGTLSYMLYERLKARSPLRSGWP